jgi:hypothetical protein
VRNWVVFDRFVPIATGSGSAIAGANCPLSYSGKGIGGWALSCIRAYPGNDAAVSAKWRRDGWRYAVDHVDRLPWVAVARERRVWGLLPLRQRLTGRSTTVEDFGVAMYFVLIVPAIYGFVVLRRRRAPVWILMTPFVLVFFTALFTYGTVRFREPAELSLVVLAAVGVAELWSGHHRRAADAPPDQTRPSPPEPARPPGEEKAPP